VTTLLSIPEKMEASGLGADGSRAPYSSRAHPRCRRLSWPSQQRDLVADAPTQVASEEKGPARWCGKVAVVAVLLLGREQRRLLRAALGAPPESRGRVRFLLAACASGGSVPISGRSPQTCFRPSRGGGRLPAPNREPMIWKRPGTAPQALLRPANPEKVDARGRRDRRCSEKGFVPGTAGRVPPLRGFIRVMDHARADQKPEAKNPAASAGAPRARRPLAVAGPRAASVDLSGFQGRSRKTCCDSSAPAGRSRAPETRATDLEAAWDQGQGNASSP